MADDQEAHEDPEIGSAAYWQLDPSEQLRICEERAGLRVGKSGGGAFMSPGAPYSNRDPIANPIDRW